MPVIKIPVNTLTDGQIKKLEKMPTSFVYDPLNKVYEYDIKSHNHYLLDWQQYLKKQDPHLKVNLKNKSSFKIKYSTLNEAKVLKINELMIDSNLCSLKIKTTKEFLEIDIESQKRNSKRVFKPLEFLKYLFLYFLGSTEVEFNQEYSPSYNFIIKKSTQLSEVWDPKNLNLEINIPPSLFLRLETLFGLSDNQKIEIPKYKFSYKTGLKTLINHLETKLAENHYFYNCLEEPAANLFPEDVFIITYLGFNYTNLCLLGEHETISSKKLINPVGKIKHYYPDILEPILKYTKGLTKKIPKGYTIENNKLYLWFKKLKKNDPTVLYLKNIFLKDSGTSICEYTSLKEEVYQGFRTNLILDLKNQSKGLFLENKNYFIVVYNL